MSGSVRRVEPDMYAGRGSATDPERPMVHAALFVRETILRVIDEEIAAIPPSEGQPLAIACGFDGADTALRRIRSRFEPDTQGGGR